MAAGVVVALGLLPSPTNVVAYAFVATWLWLARMRGVAVTMLLGTWWSCAWPTAVLISIAVVVSVLATIGAEAQRWRMLRLAVWWVSMIGGLAVLLPLSTSAAVPWLSGIWWDGVERWWCAGACLSVGVVVVGVSMRDLLRDGGTPDPFDPPHAWQHAGVYAHMHHPMQLGQMLLLCASCIALATHGALLSTTIVILVLLLMRVVERPPDPVMTRIKHAV
jgi:hypothetical protein